jgi:lipid II:glycine glycyltransferase (peptidoglycan interpeptide bridge formation enzyme)
MKSRYATPDEIKNWNTLVQHNPDGGNLFQMSESAEVKQGTGWTPRYIMSDTIAVLALERHIPVLGKFWYLPKGPSVESTSALSSTVNSLRQLAAESGVFAIKIEPELPKSTKLEMADAKRSFPVQPNSSTVLINLTPELDEVIMTFNQKGRHAIRRAERDGVTAAPVETTKENIETMYELMRQTAEGQWSLRPKAYLSNYWRTFTRSGHGQMFFASYEGKVVAASFGIVIGKNGTYKDGASVRKRTAYGASHLLQWEMMRWMKSHGVTRYDLCGTPPSARLDDPSHSLHGVGRFKTSFNKTVTEFMGAYEIPINSFKFNLWKSIVERVVLRLNSRFNRQEWY